MRRNREARNYCAENPRNDGQGVSQSEWQESTEYGGSPVLLQPPRYCKQPAHGRINAMESAERDECHPRSRMLAHPSSLREAERVRRRVPSFQADLMRPHGVKLKEELRVETHPSIRINIDLGKPAANTVRIELLVPSAV